ncbi:MAG: ATP-binding cassette domain-containing protein [Anaerolineae bacterium]|nr:ATP-binding cassette domain-containing protein [Candidatus Roseilinea sp.]MDW8449031.1 ATP-binding cassette domain-containing protein [Anaerolineae bacterium]
MTTMNGATVSVSGLAKSFGQAQAVRDVSFNVHRGEIFGLLGPNGAGKTTTIRMILDIYKPDRGEINVLGGPMTEAKKERIGYLPEERGLYKDLRVEECVLYLAELKGLSRQEARRRADAFFERLGLAAEKRKKVSEFSKGMQQKVQVIATLIHAPELIIIDEPFSGLDPVNTRLVQDLLLEEHRKGTTIIMSTHQMYQVEEMCDRIVLIDKGESVLYGSVDEIRRQYADNAVRVTAHGELPHIPGVLETSRKGNTHTLSLPKDMDPQALLAQLATTPGLKIEAFELALPTMDDIFVRVVSGKQA